MLSNAATEQGVESDGTGWELLGCPSFSIAGVKFLSPFLNESVYRTLESLLYPREIEPPAQRVLNRVVQALERNMSEFSELGRGIKDLSKALERL